MEQQELDLATQFYGLSLKVVTATAGNTPAIVEAVRHDETLAVAIEASALPDINRNALFLALRERKKRVPLLILGVTQDTNQPLLSEWSGISSISVKTIEDNTRLHYVIGHQPAITKQLTDVEFPFPGYKTSYFGEERADADSQIISVRNDKHVVPVFIKVDQRNQQIFLLCRTHSLSSSAVNSISDSTEDAFAKIASVMIFTKYCAGDQGWHATSHFANLTIDDPWLREPYGNLNYQRLFDEMEKHNFHTTVAFIPWNFDRNKAEVVSLFRSSPNRFSICVHGDNHDHKEFTDYKSKPLDGQVAALRQSLVRMENFTAQTGIPFDKVMVFPHSIAPELTLVALKENGYLATINSQNIPMGASEPPDPLFAMRPATLFFGGFPSILRYPVAPTSDYLLAINDFLDNPLFFYTHQDYFSKGIDAFDSLADQVNRIEPDTKWRSAGDIVRHLYLLKRKNPTDYDVLAFSSNIVLDNTSASDAVFYVRKQEVGVPVVSSVSANGELLPARLSNGYLEIEVPIPAGETRSIAIQYQNSDNLRGVTSTKNSLRVYVLRVISDFRDIDLSRLYVGRVATDLYYGRGFATKSIILFGCGFVALCAFLGWCLFIAIGKQFSRGVSYRLTRRQESIIPGSQKGCSITPSKGEPKL